MSAEHAKAFLTEIADNETLRKKLYACATAEERRHLAAELGFEFTAEEFNDARSRLFEKELDFVSGGSCCGHTCENEDCSVNGMG